MSQGLPRLSTQLEGSRRLRHHRRIAGILVSRAKVPAEGTGSSRSMTRHWPMPVMQMPGATAQAAAVPFAPMPDEQMPAGAMSVGVKTPTKGDQGMMDIHAGFQWPTHLGMTGMQDQSTDISVGMTGLASRSCRGGRDARPVNRHQRRDDYDDDRADTRSVGSYRSADIPRCWSFGGQAGLARAYAG